MQGLAPEILQQAIVIGADTLSGPQVLERICWTKEYGCKGGKSKTREICQTGMGGAFLLSIHGIYRCGPGFRLDWYSEKEWGDAIAPFASIAPPAEAGGGKPRDPALQR